jgi:predicted metal-binding membrane protein
MAALFALGVMSVGWMVLVAALIATEKLLPWQTVAANLAIETLLPADAQSAVRPRELADVPEHAAGAQA